MGKKKYYVVWEGLEPGIYTNWPEAQRQVKGVTGARFKSFEDDREARRAYDMGYAAYYRENPPTAGSGPKKPAMDPHMIIGIVVPLPAWGVDAACSGVPGPMEYRGVDLMTGKELFRKGPYPDGTNNVGEFLALVHALALLHQQKDSQTTVYTDSRTAMAWLKQKKAKTTLKLTRRNAPLFDLIQRAEAWLRTHPVHNPVKKWETEQWGEIPADFGRK